ncbi:MAG: LytR C-terminal domain-containing protein [Kocuria sp.]|nr:LytR C-terminal domain-containing protein [Kocuria sp.]
MTSTSQSEHRNSSTASLRGAIGLNQIPRDVFDDVPEDGRRAGTHRALDAPTPRATAGILLLIAAGAVSLLVGAAAYLLGVDPDYGASDVSAATSPSAHSTAAGSGAVAEPDSSVQVGVYNAASVNGAAGTAAQQLTDAGWSVASIDNWGVASDTSVVYYADDEQQQAQALAEELGIDEVVEDDAVSYPIVVVIGTDIAGEATAIPTPAGATNQTTAPQRPVEQTSEEQVPAEQAPVEQPPEQVPADSAPVSEPVVEPYVPPVPDPYGAVQ